MVVQLRSTIRFLGAYYHLLFLISSCQVSALKIAHQREYQS